MPRQIQVSTYTQPVAGKKCTVELSVGHKYGVVSVKHPGFTSLQASAVFCKINGKSFQDYEDMQQVEDFNTHYNRPQTAGQTDFYFVRPEMADSEDRNITGIGTADVKTFKIEFFISAAAVNPEVGFEVHAEVFANERLGLITRIQNEDVPVTSSGELVVPKMPQVGNVVCYHLKKDTQDITNIRLKRTAGDVTNDILDTTKSYLESRQKAAAKPRVPVAAKYAHLDFVTSGLFEDALQVQSIGDQSNPIPVSAIEGRFTLGTAGNVTVITESIAAFAA